MKGMVSSASINRKRAIGVAGTIGRVLLGLGFLYLAFTDGGKPEWGLQWQGPPLGLVAFPVALLAFQALRLRFTTASLNATGPVGFAVNFGIGAVLYSIPFTRDAMLLFYGSSLLLAAARGYAGCESLAISNWLLRRDDQVGCVVFSPLDTVEARATGRATADAG